MSWSVSAIGKPKAVAVKISEQINSYKCVEPEESIKQAVGQIVSTALDSFADDVAVRVSANGSQNTRNGNQVASNSLKLEIEPIHGFAE